MSIDKKRGSGEHPYIVEASDGNHSDHEEFEKIARGIRVASHEKLNPEHPDSHSLELYLYEKGVVEISIPNNDNKITITKCGTDTISISLNNTLLFTAVKFLRIGNGDEMDINLQGENIVRDHCVLRTRVNKDNLCLQISWAEGFYGKVDFLNFGEIPNQ